MKNIFRSIVLLSVVCLAACEKRDSDDISQVVKVSYPKITLKGDAIVSTAVGTGQYTDPGATSFDSTNSQSTTLTPVENKVDLTKPGFYSVKYVAKNQFGFLSEATRLVLVTTVADNVDLTGKYKRTSNNVVVDVKKVGKGLYIINNVGGVAVSDANLPFIIPVYMGHVSEMEIAVPTQPSKQGDIYCEAPELKLTPTPQFSYIVRNGAFGPARRTFVKQ